MYWKKVEFSLLRSNFHRQLPLDFPQFLGSGIQRYKKFGWYAVALVDKFNSECTDSQLNAEHWFARIKKLYQRNICLIIINNYLAYRF